MKEKTGRSRSCGRSIRSSRWTARSCSRSQRSAPTPSPRRKRSSLPNRRTSSRRRSPEMSPGRSSRRLTTVPQPCYSALSNLLTCSLLLLLATPRPATCSLLPPPCLLAPCSLLFAPCSLLLAAFQQVSSSPAHNNLLRIIITAGVEAVGGTTSAPLAGICEEPHIVPLTQSEGYYVVFRT